MSFREYLEEQESLTEGKNEDLASMMFKSKGVSEEDIKKILDTAKADDLKISIKSNYVYFKKTGKTSRVGSDFFEKMMRNKETYSLLKEILKVNSFNVSKSLSGNTSSGTFTYSATIAVPL